MPRQQMTWASVFVTLIQSFPTAKMKFISNYKHLCLLTTFQAFVSSANAKCLEKDKNHLWKQGSPNNVLIEPCPPNTTLKKKQKKSPQNQQQTPTL